jgi:hypothetical protein
VLVVEESHFPCRSASITREIAANRYDQAFFSDWALAADVGAQRTVEREDWNRTLGAPS